MVIAFDQGDLVCCGVLSGNRNFEGRIHPHTRANYLASPPLVIAYALAGTVAIDFQSQPIGLVFRFISLLFETVANSYDLGYIEVCFRNVLSLFSIREFKAQFHENGASWANECN